MKKIPTLFERNQETDKLVRNEIAPDVAWVMTGEGVATRKFDGTSVLIRNGRMFKRYEVKRGRLPPIGFEPAQDPDPETGDVPGWVPVGEEPESKWHREAFNSSMPNGTYELIGPKVQSNPEKVAQHVLVKHGAEILPDAPRDFEGLKAYLSSHGIEGIVWHHPDGRMAKLKKRDFGFRR